MQTTMCCRETVGLEKECSSPTSCTAIQLEQWLQRAQAMQAVCSAGSGPGYAASTQGQARVECQLQHVLAPAHTQMAATHLKGGPAEVYQTASTLELQTKVAAAHCSHVMGLGTPASA